MITIKRYRQRLLAVLLVLTVLQQPARAQVNPDSLRYIRELLLIEQVYDTTNYLLFNTRYRLRDIDSTGEILDSAETSYILKGSSYLMVEFPYGAVRTMQDDNYRVTISHLDSMIMVEPRKPAYLNLFGIDLYDTLFQAMNIRGATFTDSGSTRKMSLLFDSAAVLAKYDLYYDTVTHLISKIDYHIREAYYSVPPNVRVIDPDLIKISIEFYGYYAAPLSDVFFDTSLYIKRAGGKIVSAAPPYEQYEIIDLTKEE